MDNNNTANQSHKVYLNTPNIKSFVFMDTNPNEIITTVNNMPKKQLIGYDKISSYLLSLIIDEIAQPLSFIFNKSIVQGIFPDQTAKVISIHKGSNDNYSNNFRPISLFPAISKVFEKLVCNRMVNFITKLNIISPNQYGLRVAYATKHVVIDLVNCIISS